MRYFVVLISILSSFFLCLGCNSENNQPPIGGSSAITTPTNFTVTLPISIVSGPSTISLTPSLLTPTLVSTPLPTPLPTITPTPIITPSSISSKDAQAELALSLSNTWVYSTTYYHINVQTGERITKSYVITDEVIHTKFDGTFFVAEMKRNVTNTMPCLPEEKCELGQEFALKGDKSGTYRLEPLPTHYWYVIKGDEVYRQYQLELANLDSHQLLHLLPLTKQKCGYPIRKQQDFFENEYKMCPNWGYTYIEGPLNISVTAGDFVNCFKVIEVNRGASRYQWICPHVGIVAEESQVGWQQGVEPYPVGYGYKHELIKYAVQ